MQPSNPSFKIVILGSGNLAAHLGMALQQSGHNIVQIYGRNAITAAELAGKLNCPYTTQAARLAEDADFYILAISDAGILSLSEKLTIGNRIILHCAGSLPMDILKTASTNYGVLYPLFTFSKNTPVTFQHIPLCIEAANAFTREKILQLAQSLSGNIQEIDSQKRASLHLSAVFVSNFMNILNTAAYEILQSSQLPFTLLKPLQEETLRKSFQGGNPFQYQTGPAVRNDEKIIQRHIDLLNDFPDFAKIYTTLTQAIQNKNNT